MSAGINLFDALLNILSTPYVPPKEIVEAGEAIEKSAKNHQTYVYRIEDKHDRRGPFNTKATRGKRAKLSKRLGEMHNGKTPSILPVISLIQNTYKDGTPRAKSATKTLKQLREWFAPLAKELDEAGYVVAMYRTKQWVDWKKQVVFNPSLSRRVGVFSPTILEK